MKLERLPGSVSPNQVALESGNRPLVWDQIESKRSNDVFMKSFFVNNGV